VPEAGAAGRRSPATEQDKPAALTGKFASSTPSASCATPGPGGGQAQKKIEANSRSATRSWRTRGATEENAGRGWEKNRYHERDQRRVKEREFRPEPRFPAQAGANFREDLNQRRNEELAQDGGAANRIIRQIAEQDK